MFGRKVKLKQEFDDRLLLLMKETKVEWEQAKKVEGYLNDYDQEFFVRRKIAESKHFYLYKEAKVRRLASH